MIKISKHYFTLLVILIFTEFFQTGCGVYSFTGASLHPKDKTVNVEFFSNRATLVNPNLSQDFTEALKDKFVSQTSLELADNFADLTFSGEITDYRTSPVSITGGGTAGSEKAEYSRLTVTIRVKYVSVNNEDFSFDKSFSRFADYPSDQLLTDVEDELITQIIEEITDDIFNKAVVNW